MSKNLSDEDIERIALRVAELVGDRRTTIINNPPQPSFPYNPYAWPTVISCTSVGGTHGTLYNQV